jgi:hypothetical protein
MAKRRLTEPRFSFQGGLNTRQNPDSLSDRELVRAENCRLSARFGSLMKRSGSRRMHPTALAGEVTGLGQWDSPSGKQLVAVAGGRLYHKTSDLGAFTEVVPSPLLSSSVTQQMEPARSNAENAPLSLYLADGTVRKWTGSALSTVSGTDSVPNADLLANYNVRMFWRDPAFAQTLIWSVLGDPEDGTVDIGPGGGAAMVSVLRGDPLLALAKVGSSLLLATRNSISRFTGYSAEDIQIAQDTEGVSADVGPVGREAFKQIEGFVALLANRGPYIATESGVEAVGVQVEPEFQALDRSALASMVIGYHAGRREVWFAVEGPEDTGNQTVYVLNLMLQAWTGPFRYPFAIRTLAAWESAAGDDFLIAGCADGFVRHLDSGSLDDVLANGSGGSAYTMLVELAPIFFDTGPGMVKTFERLALQADLPDGETIQVRLGWDQQTLQSFDVEGLGGGDQSYRVDAHGQGRRLRVQLRDATSDISVINGLVLQAFDMQRQW